VSSATWNWTSWSIPDCNGDGTSNSDDGILLWDGEDRTTFNAASTSIPDEQKALMEVNTPAGICAGVRISEWLVLTAAHCVTDPVRNETFTGTQLQVCSNAGSGSCFPGGRVFVPSSWTGPVYSNHRYDYALVSIASSTAPSDPKMVLSSDTRNEVKKRTPKHVGWPGFFGNSSGSCDFIPPDAAQHPSAEVNGTKGGMLRLRADTSNGASGGPWYFVSGGVGRIVGVQSGFSRTSPWSGWVGGPRVHEFKNWAIATAGNR
jgi:hypothetical protein